MYFILEGREPVPVDVYTWAEWFEYADRRVALDYIYRGQEKLSELSTVFLGINHQFHPGGPPLLFETLQDGYKVVDRYATWAEALAGHQKVVQGIITTHRLRSVSQEIQPQRTRRKRRQK